jgi:hypothetical protein
LSNNPKEVPTATGRGQRLSTSSLTLFSDKSLSLSTNRKSLASRTPFGKPNYISRCACPCSGYLCPFTGFDLSILAISFISSSDSSTCVEFSITLSTFVAPGIGMIVPSLTSFPSSTVIVLPLRLFTHAIAICAFVTPFFFASASTSSPILLLYSRTSSWNRGACFLKSPSGMSAFLRMPSPASAPLLSGEYATMGMPSFAHVSATPLRRMSVVQRDTSTSTEAIYSRSVSTSSPFVMHWYPLDEFWPLSRWCWL